MKNLKLRYYLRGLGIGIVATTMVLGVALQGEEKPLTDAQIKERALELGMVDGNSLVLSDLQNDTMVKNELSEETKEPSIKEPSLEETKPDQDTQASDDAEASDASQAFGDAQDAEEMLQPVGEEASAETVSAPVEEEDALVSGEADSISKVSGEMSAEGDTVTIEIRSGAHSYEVSKVLASLGVVNDAAAYDNYLCSHGYSKKIHTGKYTIAIGASEEEIAKKITGNR